MSNLLRGLKYCLEFPGARVSADCLVDSKAVLGRGVWLRDGCEVWAGCIIGAGSYALRTDFHCNESYRIVTGKDCRFAKGSALIAVDAKNVDQCLPIVLGDGVWVGRNAIILKGVTLGNGVVVGAGSVVTHSFPDFSVIAGNPAKRIKSVELFFSDVVVYERLKVVKE